MTASTQGAARAGEEFTQLVENACVSASGVGEFSNSHARGPRPAKNAGRRRRSSRLIIATRRRKSTQPSPSELGFATPAMKRLSETREQELKQLLYDGWGKGWLCMQPPTCCARGAATGGLRHGACI